MLSLIRASGYAITAGFGLWIGIKLYLTLFLVVHALQGALK